jgi:hypothetical protein
MRPRGATLERHDPRGGAIQHRPIVRDEQHGPRLCPDLILEPRLALDVQGVVRLVEHEHVEGTGQDRLEGQALALPARERLDRPVASLRVAPAERGIGGSVPNDLGPVAAGGLPGGEGVRVGDLCLLARVAGEPLFGRAHPLRRGTHRSVRIREQELSHGRGHRVRADELAHQADVAVDTDRARGRSILPCDESEERGLADPVGADQRRVLALRHAERDALEERPSARQGVGNVRELEESHRSIGREPYQRVVSVTRRGRVPTVGRLAAP